MKDIAIYGAGGCGQEVLTLIQNINSINKEYNIIGFFDDGRAKGGIVNGFSILGNMDDLNNWKQGINVAIAIGNPDNKRNVVRRISNSKVTFPILIHPNVIMGDSNYLKIGLGCIIYAGNMITTNISIDDFVLLHFSCTVGHDSAIGKYSSFMPAVNISGEVKIGSGVFVGTGAKIINQLNIGDGTTIGAGAVVIKNLPSHCTAVGVPAKIIKYKE